MKKLDELKLLLAQMSRDYAKIAVPRDKDSPAQKMIDKATKLLVGFDEDAVTEKLSAEGKL